MIDYRTLTDKQKLKVDKRIVKVTKPGHFVNKRADVEWDEPQDTLEQVHFGNRCAECLMIYYNCLCSHED